MMPPHGKNHSVCVCVCVRVRVRVCVCVCACACVCVCVMHTLAAPKFHVVAGDVCICHGSSMACGAVTVPVEHTRVTI